MGVPIMRSHILCSNWILEGQKTRAESEMEKLVWFLWTEVLPTVIQWFPLFKELLPKPAHLNMPAQSQTPIGMQATVNSDGRQGRMVSSIPFSIPGSKTREGHEATGNHLVGPACATGSIFQVTRELGKSHRNLDCSHTRNKFQSSIRPQQ